MRLHYYARMMGESQIWVPDQRMFIDRMKTAVCDDRYGSFVNLIVGIARAKKSLRIKGMPRLCSGCTDAIVRNHSAITSIFGRTYLEMASYIWKIIDELMCTDCIGNLAVIPCMSNDAHCPSDGQPLNWTMLINYEPKYKNSHSAETTPLGEAEVADTSESTNNMPEILIFGRSDQLANIFELIGKGISMPSCDITQSRVPVIDKQTIHEYISRMLRTERVLNSDPSQVARASNDPPRIEVVE
jgi:hypothetical protein